MLYYLLFPLREYWSPLNIFRYASFRTVGAAMTALMLFLWLGPRFIAWLRIWQHGVSNVREDTPLQHQKKIGTPSFGGLLIIASVCVSLLLWGDLKNPLLLMTWSTFLLFGGIGFLDDFLKYKKRNSKGLAGKKKLFLQIIGLLLIVFVFLSNYLPWPNLPGCTQTSSFVERFACGLNTQLSIPFVSTEKFNWFMGRPLYLLFMFLVIMGTSHAVNLTDGLDGLAIGPSIISSGTFLVLSYVAGAVISEFDIARYLHIPHILGAQELAVFCSALAGAGMGFLWFNTSPAEVFMGDVGALAIGGALGMVSVLTKNELLSPIIHGVFLAETLSVMLQVASFKLTQKRIFKMAPLHHHFELKGWPEQKIVVRFWLISILLALIALSSLKIR